MDIPWSTFPRTTPNKKASIVLDMLYEISHIFRHQVIFSLLLNSMDTALNMIKTRKRIKGRYMAENKEAYMTGKPANNAPPPMTSQTSFPSQTGPIAFRAILLFLSFLKNKCHAPAPKSKPSKIAYPVNNPPITKNHKVG